MAKKKKKNYRLRKSVRRTLGALFMMSAIIVAAIPFPDAAATENVVMPIDGSVEGTTNARPTTVALDYAGKVTRDNDINKNITLSADPTTTIPAYKLIKIGNTYQYIWQYKYFVNDNPTEGVNGAIITDYNQAYTIEDVTLEDYVNSANYLYVMQDDFKAYFEFDDSTKDSKAFNKMTVDYTDWTNKNDDLAEFEYYFKNQYTNDFKTACSNYDSAIANATTDDPLTEDEITQYLAAITTAGTAYINTITNDTLRKHYFLDYIYEFEPKESTDPAVVISNMNRTDFELVYALKPIDNSSTSYDGIYIVKQLNPNATIDGYEKDSDGLLCNLLDNAPVLIGIGTNAFSNVRTGVNLKLPENLRFIADNAFLGSYVKEITINNVVHIGNYAFKNSKLEKVNWKSTATTTHIGTEAFSGTLITEIVLPQFLQSIGKGAFSNCPNLQNFVVHENSSEVTINDYAFYNCLQLNSIDLEYKRVGKIGEGAFAVTGIPTGNFTSFKFPSQYIDTDEKLGDLIFAGRTNLQEVLMPATLGHGPDEELAPNIFFKCSGLKCVEFPITCKNVTFENYMFYEVTTPDFYVKGPKMATDTNKIAGPRESTWTATRKDGRAIPYMYTENNKDYYEVCEENYVLSIDSEGVLQTCKYLENGNIVETPTSPIPKLIIPKTVGQTPINAIANGCFSKKFLEKVVGPLIIEDGSSLKEISDEVFAGGSYTHVYIGDSVEVLGTKAFAECKSLEQVTIGKNIKEIGDSAFEDCKILTQVCFREPDDFTTLSRIGTNAFSTGKEAVKLEIIGAISPEYLPFAWAMDPANYVNVREGIRVCYKTAAPTVTNILEDNYENFISDNYNRSNIQRIPTNLSVILDNTTNLPTLVDYQHYSDINEEVRIAYETGNVNGYNLLEEEQILSALYIEVPDGVKSIDAKSYYNDQSNLKNKVAYFSNDRPDNTSTKDLYTEYGLFSGYYGDIVGSDGKKHEFPEVVTLADDSTTVVKEADSKGNDRIVEIKLNSVEYLPDEVFDNCENLENVFIGDDIQELGSIPFSNCPSILRINFENDKFSCPNGIIYETLDDGTKEIVECLTGRGKVVGSSSTIDINNDSDLANTSSIREKAFSNCKNLTSFDLTSKLDGSSNVSKITSIPNACFKGCEILTNVDLPYTVTSIGNEAFADTGAYTKVFVRGKEVGLGKDAFKNVQQPYLVSYSDSAVRDVARNQNVNVDELLDNKFTVSFYNNDGTNLLKQVLIKKGESATTSAPTDAEIPKLPGMIFKGWDRDISNINDNTVVYAVYETDTSTGNGSNGSNGGSDGNNGSGGNNGSSNGNTDANGNPLYNLTVTNGEGSGKYRAGQTVTIKAGNAPKGTTFAYWSCSNENVIFNDSTDWITTLTMVNSDVTVIANYTGQYTLEVEYGSGSGSYPAGAKVTISAVEAPQGRRFASWVTKTNGLNVENSSKETTVITMPASNAKITATYMDTGTISGNSTNRPSQNGTSVVITKPGISDKDKASAYVTGSSDNFIVKISESLEAADEVQKALQKKYPDMTRIKYFAMDISLYDAKGQNKITDTTGLKVNITIPIPDALREYAGNNRVGAVVNGELETLNPKFTTINGVPSISFTATHFSPYTIYVDTGNITISDNLDSTPKTGDGIHPKWFLSLGLACISIILFTKRDRRYAVTAYH